MTKIFTLLYLLFVTVRGTSQAVPWEDQDFLDIQHDIIDWWRNHGPQATLKCRLKDHIDETAMLPRKTKKEQSLLLNLLQNSMLSYKNDVFFGTNETRMALRSKQVQMVLISNNVHISVLDYRMPLTGHHYYEYHSGAIEFPEIEISNGQANGTYFLRKCLPFSAHINRTFKRNAPEILFIDEPSQFFTAIGGIGGFFRKDTLLYSLPESRVGRRNKPRKYTWLFKRVISRD